MALFGITRYYGDDDTEAPQASSSPSKILEKLHQQAEKLKKLRLKTDVDVEEDSPLKRTKRKKNDDDSSSKKKKRLIIKDTPPLLKTKKRVKDENIEDKSGKSTKKKQKTKSGSSDSESEHDNSSTIKAKILKDELDSEADSQSSSNESDTRDVTSDNDNVDENTTSEKIVEELDENNIGGFTVIGDVKKEKVKKVHRVLPDWLAEPSVVSADTRQDKQPLTPRICGLDDDLINRLRADGITHLFPVQYQVIPEVLHGCSTGLCYGRAGYRTNDICCSAPTGSGKTLAFVLAIVQALRSRVVCGIRALVVLPVANLAVQVHKVFQKYSAGTGLKVALVVGHTSFHNEQNTLVKKGFRGFQSLADIVVATPGRLVDHINDTAGFSLDMLRFLVIDEADRMMEEVQLDWLAQVERAVYTARGRPQPLTVASEAEMEMPLQKLLFSATLSQNPEKLQQFNLFTPKLFTSVVTSSDQPQQQQPTVTEGSTEGSKQQEESNDAKESEETGEFVGKYTTPVGLTEYYVEADPGKKPLVVLYYLHHLKFRRVLCFTNSVEATHRLYLLVKLVGGITVAEYSSKVNIKESGRMLKQFADGKIDMLICSDKMARGMDIEGVRYVLNYEMPPYMKTYIHRVGRTARAGRSGTALTLLEKKEIFHFKQMVKQTRKTNVKEMKVKRGQLTPYVDAFQDALKELPELLKHSASHR